MSSCEARKFCSFTLKISGPIYKMTAVKKKANSEHPGREKEIKMREERENKM